MCGIFGVLQARPIAASALQEMSRLIRHRGPDDEGYILSVGAQVAALAGEDTPAPVRESALPYAPSSSIADCGSIAPGTLVLGHRRLSILDLTPLGHQPMSYRERYWIAYNGEVYNYVELRDELKALGHSFRSGSDTEVIVAAYAQWGEGCLSRFNGMWGLAILDTERQTLFLARDRFGVKPLYWRISEDGFAFASEIKAFIALPDQKAKANRARLLDFLIWNISDYGAETMFSDVRQLPAGHCAVLDLTSLRSALAAGRSVALATRPWYELQAGAPISGDAAERRFRELLSDAVRLRLRADVPVGSCLSGGLDSSTIVCLMSEVLRRRAPGAVQKTFTAASHDAAFDESRHARAVIAASGVEGIFVTPEPDRLFRDLDRLVWHQDEPFLSTSIFAQWCVFDAARKNGVTVMLDGQGADEALCGYRGFFGAYLAGLVRRGRLAEWARELPAMRREIGFGYLRSLAYTVAYLHPATMGVLGRFDNRAYSDRSWIRPAAHDGFDVDPVRALGGRASSVPAMSMAQLAATNLPMLLRWEDRNSMAFSVEARVPFLDYRVVELCLGMTDETKLGGGLSKRVLRESMRGIVPDQILDRRDKLGFVTAEKLWVTRDQSECFRDELARASEVLAPIVSPGLLTQFDQVLAGKRPFDHRYWRAISASKWALRFRVAVD